MKDAVRTERFCPACGNKFYFNDITTAKEAEVVFLSAKFWAIFACGRSKRKLDYLKFMAMR